MVSPWRDFAAMQERREQGQRTAPWERRLNLLKLETGSALTFLKQGVDEDSGSYWIRCRGQTEMTSELGFP